MKRLICTFLTILTLLSTVFYVGATDISADANVPMGATNRSYYDTLSNEQLLAMALSDPSLTASEIAEIKLKYQIIQPGSYMKTTRTANKTLNMSPRMQEQNNWCAAATAQQMVWYFTGWYPHTQSQMVNTYGIPAGAAAESVMNYVNARQSANTYIRVNVTNRAGFDSAVNYMIQTKNAPIIFTFKVTQARLNAGYYLYRTDGHYTNLDGQRYNSEYRIVDPYYFSQYCGTGSGIVWWDASKLWTIHSDHTTYLFY
ncbi:C39 family peptidase [Oscillospiraceae bacterium OttesenSCG-928-G22]|nr:C39 family peptidase [Oscillospiraceae bacterium OttesenSCG-928-G22]